MVSFLVLVAVLVVIGILFFRVMADFLLPMFLALLLVVIFQPVYCWFLARLGGRERVAAVATTTTIILIVLLPLLSIGFNATTEGMRLYRSMMGETGRTASPTAAAAPRADDDETGQEPLGEPAARAERFLNPHDLAAIVVRLGDKAGVSLAHEQVEETIRSRIGEWLGPVVLSSARFTGQFLIGLAVMVISLYYFLADGPWMVRRIMQLSPLDAQYEQQLVDEFSRISRAVVLATLLSAVMQGLLAGLGYYFAGASSVFLLTFLTMLLAMVPFVGATAVWLPVALWIFFAEQRPGAAIFLGVYGAAVVSMADNVIKPLVLHGRSHLHPLLALLSVLGGVKALGPIGIFVGPMVVAFLYALLNMFQQEVERMGDVSGIGTEPPDAAAAATVAPALAAEAAMPETVAPAAPTAAPPPADQDDTEAICEPSAPAAQFRRRRRRRR
jgi:predicted PurR-regulated permease PerM